MRITAIVERAQDGAWSACTPGVMVYASTRDEALQGVRSGTVGLMAYLHAQGWRLSDSNVEWVNLEV